MGCFAVCILYAGTTSFAFPTAALSMCLFLILMAVFFVAKDAVDTEEKLDFVLWVLISMGALIALYAGYRFWGFGGLLLTPILASAVKSIFTEEKPAV